MDVWVLKSSFQACHIWSDGPDHCITDFQSLAKEIASALASYCLLIGYNLIAGLQLIFNGAAVLYMYSAVG